MQIQQPQRQHNNFSQYSINQTHNLVVQNIVQNQQVKFTILHKIDHMKILYRNCQQHRFLTGLVVAGRNFIKIYALFSNLIYQQLASYKIYEDITALYSWDKCIVVQTKHKIVGLVYQDSILKNAFMLSLQFLPIISSDYCKCSFDKQGFFFSVLIKNYILLCFSGSMMNAMMNKYKGKLLYKQHAQTVTEDIKWNRPDKVYIQEVIKIKISDFQLSRIQNLNICAQSVFFIGLKNLQKPNEQGQFNQKSFYQIQTGSFFIDNKNPVVQFLAKKDKIVLGMIPYVYNKQMECLFCKKDSIYVQILRQMVLVDQFQDQNYQIIHRGSGQNFSLWVKTRSMIKVYYRKGNVFYSTNIALNFNFHNFLLKQEFQFQQGTLIYSNQTQLAMMRLSLSFIKKMIEKGGQSIEEQINLNQRQSVIIHKSFGNIIDFQLVKNSIFMIESKICKQQPSQISKQEYPYSNYQTKSKFYQLRRTLLTDPKPYITHTKKNYLEDLIFKQGIKSIKSIRFRFNHHLLSNTNNPLPNINSDNIIITQTISLNGNKNYTFYSQNFTQSSMMMMKQSSFNKQNNGLEKIITQILNYSIVKYRSKEYLVLLDQQGHLWVQQQMTNQPKLQLVKNVPPGFNHSLSLESKQINNNSQNVKQSKIYFVQNYFIYQIQGQGVENTLRFYEIFSHNYFDIKLPIQQTATQKCIYMSINRKRQSFKKKQKTMIVLEITVIFSTKIQIYEFYPEIQQLKTSYRSQAIQKGPPILSNSINYEQMMDINSQQNISKDSHKSITCPEYILFQHHTNNLIFLSIKDAFLYNYRGVSMLILINSDNELIVYKKYLSFLNQLGYVYKRVVLPLNIVKIFSYKSTDDSPIQIIGEGIIKVSNVILCKGEFLQHNVHHTSYFQMDHSLWTIQKQKIKMVDIKPLAGSNQSLFRSTLRKDSRDFAIAQSHSHQSLQDNIKIMSNFIVTPIRTMMRKQFMGLQISGDYFILYSRSGFQVISSKDMKPIWTCNLSAESPQRKQVIINIKAYDQYIAVSYYDYILDQSTQFKSIKFKFRIYNISSKTKILEKPKSTDQPILHIRSVGYDKILLATSSTLYLFHIKGQKSLQQIRTRNFSKRIALNSFSYIPQFIDQKNKTHKPSYMLFANQYGGLSFLVGKWVESDMLREQWFQNIRCHLRNVQLFHYGEQLKALITDQDNNLIVINLKANRSDKIADMNVGSKANILRVRHQQDRKIYGCFEDGTIKSISAVKLDNPEISLLDWQKQTFCKQIPFLGGFNLRISRLLSQKYRSYKHVIKGNMFDCDLLQQFFSMTTDLKQYICQKSQMRIDQLKQIIRSV